MKRKTNLEEYDWKRNDRRKGKKVTGRKRTGNDL
jgi:hypothetical protein